MREIVEDVPEVFGEPFADNSALPTMLLCRATRKKVKVALSGDGGDELFLGYDRYRQTVRGWTALKLVPEPVRAAMDRGIKQAADGIGEATVLGRLLPDALLKRPGLLASDSLEVFYDHLREAVDPNLLLNETVENEMGSSPTGRSPYDVLTDQDLRGFLPEDIHVKVDRSSMRYGLEVRAPFMDHRLVQLARSIPSRVKLKGGQPKAIPRALLGDRFPEAWFDRDKQGFGFPVFDWLRGPLEGWAEQWLNRSHLKDEGLFEPRKVLYAWDQLQEGNRSWVEPVWNVLMFELWNEKRTEGEL
jgi:asparagine synthase (glutamine-hydrolysing)